MGRFLLLVPLLLLAGCKARDGDTLRQIARRSGNKLERAAAPVTNLAVSARGSMAEISVAARVEVRLRWDRYTSEYRLAVRGDGQGTVTLTGTVADAAVKQRALELAKSTLGVETVVDEMKVGP